jgi:enoyl-CoA hydratase/carnithine racemase
MTEPALILNNHADGVTEVVLNTAPVNALTAQFLMDFADLITQLEADKAVRAIVLTSPFKVFSAGLDLKAAQAFDLAAQRDIVEGLNVGFLRLFSCAKPTVVAVNGAAIAGGLFFVLASDLRIAHSRAQFGLAEVRVGVGFPVGPMEIARATLSPDLLRRLMLTGQPVACAEAHHHGIVDIQDDDTRARALTEAVRLGQIPPAAYGAVKRQIRQAAISTIEDAIARTQTTPETQGWFTDETVPAMRVMLGGG